MKGPTSQAKPESGRGVGTLVARDVGKESQKAENSRIAMISGASSWLRGPATTDITDIKDAYLRGNLIRYIARAGFEPATFGL